MAEYEIVMTQNEWVATHIGLVFDIKGSFYSKVYPNNCMFNHGNGIFSADCWCMDKSLIWCRGNLPKNKGEYVHKPGLYGMGDWTGAQIMSRCSDVSTDWTKIIPGEGMLTKEEDHWGCYIGEITREWQGKTYTWNVVECTPLWENGIQTSWVDPDGTRRAYKGDPKSYGKWHKHGKLDKWIDYTNGAKVVELDAPKDATQIVINLK